MTPRKLFTLIFVKKDKDILLGFKKRGFGVGKWHGFGGKVEPNETILQGAFRELEEESGLIATDLHKIGLLVFEIEGDPTLLEVHVFETNKYKGTPTESDEMRPQWYDQNNLPYDSMWPNYVYWYPYLLRSEPFKGYFLYRGNDIVKHKLEKLDLKSLSDV